MGETMVRITQQKIEGASKRVKDSIIEIKEFLEKNITDQTHNKMTLLKVKLERHTDNLKEILGKINEQEENEINTDDYEDSKEEADILVDILQMAITNYCDIKEKEREEKLQRELKEIETQKERELKELEMQKEKEIEMKKLAIEEKI